MKAILSQIKNAENHAATKRHSLASPISYNGKTPRAAHAVFSEWQNAMRSPNNFRRVAKCHASASSISACGKTP